MKRLVLICCFVIATGCLSILIFCHRQAGIDEQLGSAPEISASQILAHSSAIDCWAAIGGSVYDLTNYFAKHPNTSLAESPCGKTMPQLESSSELTADTLLTYRIGILIP